MYADLDLQHSTKPPIPALPVGQVQYATVQSQTDKTKSKVTGEPVYADLQHSTNPPIPALTVGQVQYATVQSQTDETKSKVTGKPAHHSTNPPAPPLPAKPHAVPVHHTTVTVTNKTSPQVSSVIFAQCCLSVE